MPPIRYAIARSAVAAVALLAAPALAKKPAPAVAELAVAPLIKGDGAAAGVATIVKARGGLALKLALSGLAPGVHGLHLHTTGVCVGPDFASAGGHLNPAHHQHGHDNPLGAHLGDLPNITADAEGRVNTTIALEGVAPEALFDADGTALVVHAKPDDYKTDPAGNAGGRIACGVLRRPG